ncbi:hypothetical protein Taro_027343 [Colocasia esculenta]|uniref:Uncharacterized protein n=1 Tax=Colocasia esculenta TaxID=4460 RepID=A0A843VHT3_COLES|nr:hypothetical protein [Colocasia esculenta]
MVLWEITVATAYFLGLKRTYRLALKLQRRVVGPRHPKLRRFLHRRTRAAFDIALSVHKKIQERDIEIGRNLGNWILRWLDRLKPSAEIRPPTRDLPSNNLPKQIGNSGQVSGSQGPRTKLMDQDSGKHLFVTPWNMRPKSSPTISWMVPPASPGGMGSQYRHIFNYAPNKFEGVFRKDIAQWMQQC